MRGSWVARLVKHLTLDFGSGHDVTLVGLGPTSGSVLSVKPASDPLSPSLSAPPLLTCVMTVHSASVKISKLSNNTLKEKKKEFARWQDRVKAFPREKIKCAQRRKTTCSILETSALLEHTA